MRDCSRASLLLLTLLLALFAFSGCGGGTNTEPVNDEPTELPPAQDGDGNTLPPPNPPQAPIWDASAASYGRTPFFGAFPSDLVRHGTTLFAVDADQIDATGANVLAFDVSGAAPVASSTFAATQILASDLRDSADSPGDVNNPVGFGFFLNDVLIVSDTLGFVLVNAGGSDSAPTLSNVVAFNPTTGVVRQVFNLAVPYITPGPLFDSAGGPLPAGTQYVQSGAEGMAYVETGPSAGRLFVAMSNLIFAAPSFGADKLPGTVQILAVDPSEPAPLSGVPALPLATATILTQSYNPVAVHAFVVQPQNGGDPIQRLMVTCAGTTGFDADFNLVPMTASSVEVYDALAGTFTGAFDLGLAGLAALRPALGQDAAGHEVGFFPSSVTGEIYLLRLDGLFTETLDFSQLTVLRGPGNGIPVAAAQAGGPGGNITGVALAPDGRHVVITGFGDLFSDPQVPGRLFILSLPENVVTGSGFTPDFTPGSTEFGAAPGRAIGNAVIVPGDGTRPDVYVNVSGALDEDLFGAGPAHLGTLNTRGLIK